MIKDTALDELLNYLEQDNDMDQNQFELLIKKVREEQDELYEKIMMLECQLDAGE